MPKTEVILTSNVVGLGAESDQIKVAAGFARNYLFPQGLAIPLTSANKRRLEVLRQRRAEREAHELNTMTELGSSLSKLTLVIAVKTGEDGKMFGSVTAGTIAEELKHQFEATVDKRKIHLPQAIKKLGDYDVELRLHADVVTTLKIRVESSTPVTAPPPASSAAPGAKETTYAKTLASERAPSARADSKKDRPERKPRGGKAQQSS
ncbi:MAG: 50S ribosomal protein L9 [Verrucomicrobia bacterium]|nr:50S ribosomal protein L9 [Verrucomicrobiota bacterium]